MFVLVLSINLLHFVQFFRKQDYLVRLNYLHFASQVNAFKEVQIFISENMTNIQRKIFFFLCMQHLMP